MTGARQLRVRDSRGTQQLRQQSKEALQQLGAGLKQPACLARCPAEYARVLIEVIHDNVLHDGIRLKHALSRVQLLDVQYAWQHRAVPGLYVRARRSFAHVCGMETKCLSQINSADILVSVGHE